MDEPVDVPAPSENPDTHPVTTGGKLRRDVWVAGEDDEIGSPLKRIPRDTDARNIPPSELAQLCQEHFV